MEERNCGGDGGQLQALGTGRKDKIPPHSYPLRSFLLLPRFFPFSSVMATAEATQASKPRTQKEIDDALAMPPPPNPIKDIILEPELYALTDSLKVQSQTLDSART